MKKVQDWIKRVGFPRQRIGMKCECENDGGQTGFPLDQYDNFNDGGVECGCDCHKNSGRGKCVVIDD